MREVGREKQVRGREGGKKGERKGGGKEER